MSDAPPLTAGDDGDPVLAGLENSAAALRRIADLEVAGRTMMTFMRGHMDEVAALMDVGDYMARFYDDHAREYLQRDEYDFVVHHCLRTLYRVWAGELRRIVDGPLGDALAANDAPLPVPGDPVREGREPVAEDWFGEVEGAVLGGRLPERPGPGNPVMAADECRLQDEPGLIRGQFVIWCGEVWARAIPPVWDLVREAIAIRRLGERPTTGSAVTARVDDRPEAYRRAVDRFRSLLEGWRAFHAETVNVHDPMYEAYVEPLYGWVGSHEPALATWRIKDDTKFELYLEVATTVAALRGDPIEVPVPEADFWRSVPWNPTVIGPGAPGCPPFETVQPSHTRTAASRQVGAGPMESPSSPLAAGGDPLARRSR